MGGSGVFTTSTYRSLFEQAMADLEKSITECSLSALQSATVNGVASIEAYIRYRATQWNRQHLDDVLVDDRNNKVTFDDKF